jgi:arylsulfatase A
MDRCEVIEPVGKCAPGQPAFSTLKNQGGRATRLFMFVLVLACAAAAVAYLAYVPGPTNNTSRPNIVIILADDLGYGDVSSNYAKGKILTPNIDQLAEQGMRFTDAHSGAAVCSPTRYGLLTGQHFLRQPWAKSSFQLSVPMIDAERLTLPEMLQEHGYHTGAFGKWHLGQTFYTSAGENAGPGPTTDWSKPTSGGPNDQGFDEFFGSAFTHAQFLRALMHNRLVTEVPTEFPGTLDGPGVEGFDPATVMPLTTQRVLDYIDWNASERSGEPFFIYFAPVAVHNPLVPSPDFVGKSEVGAYGDFVLQTDAAVGKVMDKLREHDLVENTLIIFSSDNGSAGQVRPKTKNALVGLGTVTKKYGHKVNGPWRGYKGQLWEGGHRVPLIARWPEIIQAGQVSDQLVVLEDIMATVAAILKVNLPAGSAEDSYDILPELAGTDYVGPRREYAVLSTFNGDPVLRKDNWVFAAHLGSGGQFRQNEVPTEGGPQGQLYDLLTDPEQQENVWLEHPEMIAQLTALYEEHARRGRSLGVSR